MTAPATLEQACHDGVAGEIGNYRMYDHLLAEVQAADVRVVFSHLRNASAYHHLPAFSACAGVPVPDIPPAAGTTPWTPLVAGIVTGAALSLLLRRAQ